MSFGWVGYSLENYIVNFFLGLCNIQIKLTLDNTFKESALSSQLSKNK